MLATLKSYLYGAGAALMALLGALAWYWRESAKDANETARRAENKAQASEAARKHVMDVTEATREVEEESSRLGPDARRDRLRDQWSAASRD